jgi:uncharacterized membrane protein YedE/YeeE
VIVFLVSFFLVAWLGFAAHRASICTVKAVAEVLSTHQAYMFLSFAKTVLWVMAISLPILWLAPMQNLVREGSAPTVLTLAGGFLFSVGVTLNGGCAFSTLAHLADGDLGMLARLLGYCAGIAGWLAVETMRSTPY